MKGQIDLSDLTFFLFLFVLSFYEPGLHVDFHYTNLSELLLPHKDQSHQMTKQSHSLCLYEKNWWDCLFLDQRLDPRDIFYNIFFSLSLYSLFVFHGMNCLDLR